MSRSLGHVVGGDLFYIRDRLHSCTEKKLFVGMLSKKLNENEVRSMFSPFGSIEEAAILRDSGGASKGCAFITYNNRESCLEAIKTMHQSQTMEVSYLPLFSFS